MTNSVLPSHSIFSSPPVHTEERIQINWKKLQLLEMFQQYTGFMYYLRTANDLQKDYYPLWLSNHAAGNVGIRRCTAGETIIKLTNRTTGERVSIRVDRRNMPEGYVIKMLSLELTTGWGLMDLDDYEQYKKDPHYSHAFDYVRDHIENWAECGRGILLADYDCEQYTYLGDLNVRRGIQVPQVMVLGHPPYPTYPDDPFCERNAARGHEDLKEALAKQRANDYPCEYSTSYGAVNNHIIKGSRSIRITNKESPKNDTSNLCYAEIQKHRLHFTFPNGTQDYLDVLLRRQDYQDMIDCINNPDKMIAVMGSMPGCFAQIKGGSLKVTTTRLL